MTQYDYTKNPCVINRLIKEIQISAIVTILDHVTLFGDALSILFVSDLSVNDKIILDAIVINHTGNPWNPDFNEYSSNVITSTTSSSYVLMNSMISDPLDAGMYYVSFTGSIKTNAPPLSTPGFYISLFAGGVQVPASEISDVSTSVNLFGISPIAMTFNCSVNVTLNQKLEIKWKTNGEGNTLTCANRVFDVMKIK